MRLARILLAALVVLALAGIAQAAESVVWQIGKADNNYAEFAVAGDYGAYAGKFGGGVAFAPTKDDPAKSWPFIQPGPDDSWAGSRRHPFTIAFRLDGQPSGMYTLTVDLVNTHYGRSPVYEVSVNGRSGRFTLPAGAHDEALTDASKGREHVLKIPIPASFFRSGENKVVLTTVDGSWVLYDALSLTNDPSAAAPPPSVDKIELKPTILFVRDGSALRQIVNLSVQASPGVSQCRAEVRIGDKAQMTTIPVSLLGTAQCDLRVEEITAPVTAEVIVSAGSVSKSATIDLKPQRKWKLYVQPSAHVDIGYTDWQERVVELHNRNTTLALDLCRQYPDFRWNTESAWVQDNYLTMMSEDKRAEFLELAKEGRVGCQAIYGNMLTGICSHESFIRDLYYARNMSRKYGIAYDIAMSSDVPTQVWTLPTVLAGAGIKYFSAGLNLTRGNSFDRFFSKPLFYWQGPDGGRVLTWVANGYGYAGRLGLDGSTDVIGRHLDAHLKGFDREDYPCDAVLAFGGYMDNVPLNGNLASAVAEWNKKYAYPRIIFCRGPEFFSYVESNYGDKIPTFSGDGGVYWEDGAGSSAAETAMVRQAKETLAASEKLWSLTSTLFGASYPKDDIYEGWKNSILYDEHTWGAHCSISQPEHEQTLHQWEVKAGFATKADASAKEVVAGALGSLVSSIKHKDKAIVVFNPMSWPVSDWVITGGEEPGIPVYAQNVPPLGYKVIPMPAKETVDRALPPGTGVPVMENSHYKIVFDPVTGGVRSLYDKDLKRELVDQNAPYRLNQYIYTLGKRQGQSIADIRDVTRDGVTSPVTFHSRIYDVGRVMRIRGSAKNAPEWTQIVALYDKVKRVEFINVVNKQETLEQEAGYFAFPFALDKPEWLVELPNGVVKPRSQMLPGACTDWYSHQDFVAAADGQGAVVWTGIDSPLVTLGDINRETFRSPALPANGHLYAYAFNNYWFTNYKASQGGEMMFRFSLTSMPKYDPVAASRFGQSVRSPLLAVVAEPNAKGVSSATSGSLCTVDKPNVIIQAVKQAESGKGLVIRLRELCGTKTQAVITLSGGKFREAWSCNLVEDPQTKLPVTGGKVKVVVPAKGLATVLVK